MATKKKSSEKKGSGGRPRHDDPIGVGKPVDELPPRRYKSQSATVIAEIEQAGGKWVPLDPAGRQPGSVQSMLNSASERMGKNIEVSVRGDEVYARDASQA